MKIVENDVVLQIAKDFFQKLCIEVSEVNVREEANDVYYIKVQTPDSGIVIGPKWRNLDDIQTVLRIILNHTLGKNIILHIEVNDYLQAKEEKLLAYVKTKMELVEKSGKDFRLPYLTSYERKKVHAFVAELANPNIYTKSLGEWSERRLHLCKKDEKMTIDIEWNDI